MVPRLASARSSSRIDLGAEHLEIVEQLASSDDMFKFFAGGNGNSSKHSHQTKSLGELMQKNLITAHPETTLADADAMLKGIEGLPVVDGSNKLVGVLSKKDFKKGGTLVKDVMSTDVKTLHPTAKASEAAHLMIDNKIHRVPVVDDQMHCVGIVTRTDIFWALASEDDRATWFQEHGIDI